MSLYSFKSCSSVLQIKKILCGVNIVCKYVLYIYGIFNFPIAFYDKGCSYLKNVQIMNGSLLSLCHIEVSNTRVKIDEKTDILN
ncbi:hypothetical protein BCSAG_57880 [Bacillus cereus]